MVYLKIIEKHNSIYFIDNEGIKEITKKNFYILEEEVKKEYFEDYKNFYNAEEVYNCTAKYFKKTYLLLSNPKYNTGLKKLTDLERNWCLSLILSGLSTKKEKDILMYMIIGLDNDEIYYILKDGRKEIKKDIIKIDELDIFIDIIKKYNIKIFISNMHIREKIRTLKTHNPKLETNEKDIYINISDIISNFYNSLDCRLGHVITIFFSKIIDIEIEENLNIFEDYDFKKPKVKNKMIFLSKLMDFFIEKALKLIFRYDVDLETALTKKFNSIINFVESGSFKDYTFNLTYYCESLISGGISENIEKNYKFDINYILYFYDAYQYINEKYNNIILTENKKFSIDKYLSENTLDTKEDDNLILIKNNIAISMENLKIKSIFTSTYIQISDRGLFAKNENSYFGMGLILYDMSIMPYYSMLINNIKKSEDFTFYRIFITYENLNEYEHLLTNEEITDVKLKKKCFYKKLWRTEDGVLTNNEKESSVKFFKYI